MAGIDASVVEVDRSHACAVWEYAGGVGYDLVTIFAFVGFISV